MSHLAYQAGITHAHTTTPTKGESTPLARFFRRVSLLFTSKEAPVDKKLSGRISELQTTTDHMLRDLKTFKENLEKDTDYQLFTLVCTIIDPIIKEISRLQKAMGHKMSAMQQVKTVARYVEWIEKARVWVELDSANRDPEQIRQVVINQTVQEFQSRIDRDVQVIQDYMNHAAENLRIPDGVSADLKKKLMPTLTPILLKLYALKEVQDLTVDTLMAWRCNADRQREHLFSASLHTIDTFFTG